MGTRALIGKMNKDGTVSGIYLHWDGYPSHAGAILDEYYSTDEAISELIEHGSCSSIGKSIGAKHDFNERLPDCCTFYHRDRDEELNIQNFSSRSAFMRTGQRDYDWAYLYENGGWVTVRGG